MKNVTVTMEERVLRQARIAAASEGKSLSKFISDVVQQRVGRGLTQEETLERFLAGPAWTSDGSPLQAREEINEERFRRHERVDLRAGPGFSEEGAAGSYMAEGAGKAKRGDR